MDDTPFPRVARLLAPYKLAALADATNRSRQSAHAWQTADALPDAASVIGLSRLTRVSVEDLTVMIAADAADKNAARSQQVVSA